MDLFRKCLIGVCAMLVVFAVVMVALAIFDMTTGYSCSTSTTDIGIPHQWSFWGGCKVFDDGRWIPLDNWRYIGNDG